MQSEPCLPRTILMYVRGCAVKNAPKIAIPPMRPAGILHPTPRHSRPSFRILISPYRVRPRPYARSYIVGAGIAGKKHTASALFILLAFFYHSDYNYGYNDSPQGALP